MAVMRTDGRIQQLLDSELGPLYRELAKRVRGARSAALPYALERLVSPDEARILIALPATVDEVAGQFEIDTGLVRDQMRVLFEKGLISPAGTAWRMKEEWGRLYEHAAWSSDHHLSDDFLDLAWQVTQDWNRQMVTYVAKTGRAPLRLPSGEKSMGIMRVIPRWRAIAGLSGVLPAEDAREILKEPGPIVLHNCVCKKIDRNRECQDTIPVESCISVGDRALLERGCGREMSYDEALAYVTDLDRFPLIHLTQVRDIRPRVLCNCHPCCCGVFALSRLSLPALGLFGSAKSRFVATVDARKCRGCRTCEKERCPVEAIGVRFHPEFGDERAQVDAGKCLGCGLCVLSCPEQAIGLSVVRPPGHLVANSDRSI